MVLKQAWQTSAQFDTLPDKDECVTDNDQFEISADKLYIKRPYAMDHPNLTEYWTLDGDALGKKNGYNGNVLATLVPNGGVWGQDCYSFNGNQEINVPQTGAFETNIGTIICWLKPNTSTPTTRFAFGMAYDALGWNDPWTAFYIGNYGQAIYGHSNYGGVGKYQSTGASALVLDNTKWQMVAFVNDGDKYYMWHGINGVLTQVHNVDHPDGYIAYTNHPSVMMGAKNPSDYGQAYVGEICECKHYGAALSPSDITELYNSGNKFKLQSRPAFAPLSFTTTKVEKVVVRSSDVSSTGKISRVEIWTWVGGALGTKQAEVISDYIGGAEKEYDFSSLTLQGDLAVVIQYDGDGATEFSLDEVEVHEISTEPPTPPTPVPEIIKRKSKKLIILEIIKEMFKVKGLT